MSGKQYNEYWERKKQYLIRSLFQDLPDFSTIREEDDDSSAPRSSHSPISYTSPASPPTYHPRSPRTLQSADGRWSPLPPLIIEIEPNKHDEPEEYYVQLERKIKKIYRKLFFNEDVSDILSDQWTTVDEEIDFGIDDGVQQIETDDEQIYEDSEERNIVDCSDEENHVEESLNVQEATDNLENVDMSLTLNDQESIQENTASTDKSDQIESEDIEATSSTEEDHESSPQTSVEETQSNLNENDEIESTELEFQQVTTVAQVHRDPEESPMKDYEGDEQVTNEHPEDNDDDVRGPFVVDNEDFVNLEVNRVSDPSQFLNIIEDVTMRTPRHHSLDSAHNAARQTQSLEDTLPYDAQLSNDNQSDLENNPFDVLRLSSPPNIDFENRLSSNRKRKSSSPIEFNNKIDKNCNVETQTLDPLDFNRNILNDYLFLAPKVFTVCTCNKSCL